MREIKFRAFQDGIMIYPTGALINIGRFFRVIREDAIIMQFTGLLDKNGKEIYEFDLAKVYYKGNWVVCEVVWNKDGLWCLKWKDGYINNYKLHSESLEIIGNRFENPELL